MRLTSTTSWEKAAELLTTLPPSFEEAYGSINFMKAGKFQKNGKRLFEEFILPKIVQLDTEFEVLSGYVDSSLLFHDIPYANDMSAKFERAVVRDIKTQIEYTICIE